MYRTRTAATRTLENRLPVMSVTTGYRLLVTVVTTGYRLPVTALTTGYRRSSVQRVATSSKTDLAEEYRSSADYRKRTEYMAVQTRRNVNAHYHHRRQAS